MSLSIIILAAGQGTRMYSDIPKVLHPLAGKPLLEHVYNTACLLTHSNIHIVYGFGGETVPDQMKHLPVHWIEQREQLGTGHAVAQVMPDIRAEDQVLILCGDIPLITVETLRPLVDAAGETGFSLLTVDLDVPAGYGRIIRDAKNRITRIVEEKDASRQERAIREVNTGMMVVVAASLQRWIKALGNDNAQKEYYLTDIVSLAVAEGVKIRTISAESAFEVKGINTRAHLAEAERYFQLVQAHHLMRHGVTLLDPSRFDLRGDLEVGRDTVFDINVLLEGRIKLGNHVSIGANCCIRDTMIADDVTILPNCVIENAIIGRHCRIGPFSRIRPDTILDDDVHIGNFVEVKKTDVGTGTKINHLSYIGDSEIGREVNIGAGTITCNFDGANKHKTIIEDDVFVGSDVQLVAPVRVGAGATIAAGTTVTRDVKAGSLAISRVAQKTRSGWKRPNKG
ncbi:MAG: UDP-N-acetylglucosamine diphosphorylase/glucosamine-1-phosphate N-acetyltransferase [Gammaproteobacteria bacterium RBG_16_51_14]|nr:MAG: UDP-N-acetylglucosamine diphosphorylase/glucosamine-1-phosphate N-acetyltransferase [Gammaproteobacteria bacterium RBG_16_51_14]